LVVGGEEGESEDGCTGGCGPGDVLGRGEEGAAGRGFGGLEEAGVDAGGEAGGRGCVAQSVQDAVEMLVG